MPELKSPLQRNLYRLMQARGHTMRSLSDAAGLGETAVRDIVVGRSQRPSFKQLDAIAKVLSVTVGDLTDEGHGNDRSEVAESPMGYDRGRSANARSASNSALLDIPLPVSLRAEPVELGRPDLPILGKAAGGRGELVIGADAAPIGWTFRPPQLRGLSDVFAVYATGTSMVPMYRPGQTIIARIDMPLSAGDGIIIEKLNDEAMIKEFVRYCDDGIEVREYQPKERVFTVRSAEIRRVSRIYAALDFR